MEFGFINEVGSEFYWLNALCFVIAAFTVLTIVLRRPGRTKAPKQ